MKKVILVILMMSFIIVGCGKKKDTLELVSNGIYSDPKAPVVKQIEAFNELGMALEEKSETKIVKQMAISFAYDFYSFKNKTDENDIGGLTYFLETKRADVKKYFSFYFYKNYSSILNQYGKESLPQVSNVIAVEPVATTFKDKTLGALNAYSVRLDLSYEDTKLPKSALKTETAITLVKFEGVWRIVEIA